MKDAETALETAILHLLSKRDINSSLCPGEAARKCFPEDWRSHMDLCRKVATRLAIEGKIEITRKGVPLQDPSRIRGPVRLRLPGSGKSRC
jgi:hypothetical protein